MAQADSPADRSARETRAPRLAWCLDGRFVAVSLAVLLWLEVWAAQAVDPDYFLPDAFRPVAIGLVALLLVAGLLPWRLLRRAVVALSLFPVASVLLLEAYATFRPGGGEGRLVRSDDPLLRYHYRPNATVEGANGASTINRHGLWDRDYTIPKPLTSYRVLTIGGSLGNDGSIPFAKRYHERLERLLEGAHPAGKQIEVINVSCEGYNTLQQVRLLEKVGLQYEPDFVVVAYQLSDPFLQDGSGRRVGNSRFLFRLTLPLRAWADGSRCSLFEPIYDNYGYHLVVLAPLERLRLLGEIHGFFAAIAVMPVLEKFDDPVCTRIYDGVLATAARAKISGVLVADAFVGEPVSRFAKQGARSELTHPNADGHELIAEVVAKMVREQFETTKAAEPPAAGNAPDAQAEAIERAEPATGAGGAAVVTAPEPTEP